MAVVRAEQLFRPRPPFMRSSVVSRNDHGEERAASLLLPKAVAEDGNVYLTLGEKGYKLRRTGAGKLYESPFISCTSSYTAPVNKRVMEAVVCLPAVSPHASQC